MLAGRHVTRLDDRTLEIALPQAALYRPQHPETLLVRVRHTHSAACQHTH
jgi:hypothetical protein